MSKPGHQPAIKLSIPITSIEAAAIDRISKEFWEQPPSQAVVAQRVLLLALLHWQEIARSMSKHAHYSRLEDLTAIDEQVAHLRAQIGRAWL